MQDPSEGVDRTMKKKRCEGWPELHSELPVERIREDEVAQKTRHRFRFLFVFF